MGLRIQIYDSPKEAETVDSQEDRQQTTARNTIPPMAKDFVILTEKSLCYKTIANESCADLQFFSFFFFCTLKYGCLRITDANMTSWPTFIIAICILLSSTSPLSRIAFCNDDLIDLVSPNCSASSTLCQLPLDPSDTYWSRRTGRWSTLLSVKYCHLVRLWSSLVPN